MTVHFSFYPNHLELRHQCFSFLVSQEFILSTGTGKSSVVPCPEHALLHARPSSSTANIVCDRTDNNSAPRHDRSVPRSTLFRFCFWVGGWFEISSLTLSRLYSLISRWLPIRVVRRRGPLLEQSVRLWLERIPTQSFGYTNHWVVFHPYPIPSTNKDKSDLVHYFVDVVTVSPIVPYTIFKFKI